MEQHYSIRTYFKLNRVFMVSSGVWPYQPLHVARIIRLLWITQHISIMTPEIIKLIEVRGMADLLLECIPSVFYNIVIAVLYGTTIHHQRKIKELIEKIQKNWITISKKSEVEILTRYSNMGIRIGWLYIGALYFTLFIFCLFPLSPIVMDYVNPLNVSRQRLPLYRVQFFVDDKKYYWTILMHAYTTTMIGIIPLLTVDLFLANCTQHICGMMLILGKRLEKTMETTKLVVNKLDDNIYKDIRKCTILHTEILDFIEDINYIFSTAFGILLAVLTFLTSFTGIVVLIKWGDWNEVIRFGMFTMAELFHAFCYSYHSQDVIDHNNQIHKSIMNSGWYKSSMRTRVLVQMMFLRSNKPCLINCIIFPLSMENFTTILKTMFSYFTVVKSCRF
ncbi:odorant receptor 202 [Nasonia vitripennis]|uniref:Odorant receptor n=1 Tax=Nasonia vitripennis TaxID=7425 RepID=A0A7M6W5W5_NASVI|nr:odorant receptor 202 [Nasonia vitripennis]